MCHLVLGPAPRLMLDLPELQESTACFSQCAAVSPVASTQQEQKEEEEEALVVNELSVSPVVFGGEKY